MQELSILQGSNDLRRYASISENDCEEKRERIVKGFRISLKLVRTR